MSSMKARYSAQVTGRVARAKGAIYTLWRGVSLSKQNALSQVSEAAFAPAYAAAKPISVRPGENLTQSSGGAMLSPAADGADSM